MSRSLARALLIALLALTVPVQGLAALSAGICMALGHHGGEASAHSEASAGEHGGRASAAHHHEDAAGSGEDSPGSYCAPCVSCCAAAAIAPSSPAALHDPAVSPPAPAPLAFLQGIAPHRLERPPLAL